MAHKWVHWLHGCYRQGVANASERTKWVVAHKWADWLRFPNRPGGPNTSKRGPKPEMAHKWAYWPPHPCHMGGTHRLTARDTIRSGPDASNWGHDQKLPKSGRIGYVTIAIWGFANALEWGTNSVVGHKRADWLCYPCRLGDRQRITAGNKVSHGPQVGGLATPHLPCEGSPTPQSEQI